jgi:predicted transposase YdaD
VRPCLNNRKRTEGRKEGKEEKKEERKEEGKKENSDYLELDIQGLKIITLTVARWICFQST